jgi:hypothetical protein
MTSLSTWPLLSAPWNRLSCRIMYGRAMMKIAASEAGMTPAAVVNTAFQKLLVSRISRNWGLASMYCGVSLPPHAGIGRHVDDRLTPSRFVRRVITITGIEFARVIVHRMSAPVIFCLAIVWGSFSKLRQRTHTLLGHYTAQPILAATQPVELMTHSRVQL